MKQLKVLSVVVLILDLCLSGFSQEQTKEGETADDLLIKGIEYIHGDDINAAITYFIKALKLDYTKNIYIEILNNMLEGKFAEALKRLDEKRYKSPLEKELKVIQILAADTHFRWAFELKRKHLYIDAIKHLEAAYDIDIIYRPKYSAIELSNIGFLYDFLGKKRDALEYFEKALPIYTSVKDRSSEATTLNNIASVYSFIGKNQNAKEYLEKALLIYHEVGERSGEATTLNGIGMVCSDLGQKQKALEYYEKALPIARELGDRSIEATTLNNIGTVLNDLGKKQNALEYLERAFPIFREVGNRSGEATTLNNIASIFNSLGQKRKALVYHEKVLIIRREVGDISGEATTRNNIGRIYSDLGQKHKALEHIEKALAMANEVGDRSGEAIILDGIGKVYNSLGEKEKALTYYEKALPIHREVEDRTGEATTLNDIANVYNDIGEKQKALEFYENALSIYINSMDKVGEAATLNNIASVYYSLGQIQKVLECYEKALPIVRKIGYQSGEAVTLNNIGCLYSELGQLQNALEYYEKALPIREELGDRLGEATTLNNIGLVYFSLGQTQKALEFFEKVLPICQEVGARFHEATILNNMGIAYNRFGQKQKGEEFCKKSLSVRLKMGDLIGEANSLNSIGSIHYDLDQRQKTLESLEKALLINRKVGDRKGEAVVLNNLGMVYFELGQDQKALDYYHKALLIFQELMNPFGEAGTLNNIGGIYSKLGQKQKAMAYYEKALPILCEVGDLNGEAITLNNLGSIYKDIGQNQKALEYYEKVLPILREVKDLSSEATIFNNIGELYYHLGQKKKGLLIFYVKQAVNALQYLRQNIDNLDSKAKIKYLQSNENTYKSIASQLIFAGRLGEAQQVLDILKDEECFSFFRRESSAYMPKYNPLDYTEFERKWIDLQNILLEKMSSVSTPYHELLIKPNKTPEEEKKLDELKINREKAQIEYRDFLNRMKKEFEAHEDQKKLEIDQISKRSSTLKEFLKSLYLENNGKTVVLNFLVYKSQISVIITTPTAQIIKQSPLFDDKEFNEMIYYYRDMIEKFSKLNRGGNLLPNQDLEKQKEELSRQKSYIETKLYNLIFQTVDKYLEQYGAVNLIVSLDGVLRYIPLSSLYDGKHYMLQKYRIVLLSPTNLKQFEKKQVIENKILGMGASKGCNGFMPLHFVDKEIRAIVNDREKGCTGLINGNAFIDNDFTRETMFSSLKTSSYPFVHIASHFQFSPGDETKNQLLLGDGSTLNLMDIRKEGKLFDGVKLLVLSACQTGMGGNGEEIDGFGELAQQCGAASVIATLWAVDDESTKDLMVKFYSILKRGKVSSKIEALRQAQLQLAGLEDLIDNSMETVSAASGEKADYSHPYYWAPFIMMGNWR